MVDRSCDTNLKKKEKRPVGCWVSCPECSVPFVSPDSSAEEMKTMESRSKIFGVPLKFIHPNVSSVYYTHTHTQWHWHFWVCGCLFVLSFSLFPSFRVERDCCCSCCYVSPAAAAVTTTTTTSLNRSILAPRSVRHGGSLRRFVALSWLAKHMHWV